jgi:benzaldehyde dehydrogenase (NAD)
MSLLDSKQWTGKIHVGGWVPGSGGEYTVREPATDQDLGSLGLATADDVRTAASQAAEAQVEWAARPYDQRAAILRKAANLWTEHAGEVSEWIVREAGSTPPKAGFEIHMAESLCNAAAALTLHPYGELIRSTQPDCMSLTRRLPAGVVGVIAPFNVPLVLAIRYVAPALALGNAVLLKPDPRTAVSGGVTLARIFEEAGLPPGVFGVLPGGVDVGEAIISDPAVSVIVFTGSTRGGRAVAERAARHLKRVHLELGGNSAFVVLEDADLERAISAGAFGSFFHQGQVCMSASRHLVQSSIAAQYTELMVEHADRLTVGNPSTEQVALGPIIDAAQRDRIHGLVTSSVDAGARLVAGGTYDGLFYRPTVLADVPTNAPAYVEEIFGPVAPITAFDTLDEAAKLAADTPYGLSLSIVTRDVMKGMKLAERIPSGLVHINDQPIHDEPTVPFGGVKDSGAGSHLGGFAANLDAFTELQWITMRTDVPPYPF